MSHGLRSLRADVESNVDLPDFDGGRGARRRGSGGAGPSRHRRGRGPGRRRHGLSA